MPLCRCTCRKPAGKLLMFIMNILSLLNGVTMRVFNVLKTMAIACARLAIQSIPLSLTGRSGYEALSAESAQSRRGDGNDDGGNGGKFVRNAKLGLPLRNI